MAKLTRALENHPKHELGLLKDAHGILASTPEESLKILCDIHFHQSTNEEINQEEHDLQQANIKIGNFTPQPAEWRSSARVRKAISMFENRKSSGPDKLPPKLLKHLPDNAINLLCKFYDACMNTGYTWDE